MFSIRRASKIYRNKKGVQLRALDDVSIDFPDKGLAFILGKSGSGKSTLLNILGGLDVPDTGEIIIDGVGSASFSAADFDGYRNARVGFVFQEYNLLPEFTVAENISLALELQGKTQNPESVTDILRQVGMEGFGERKPNTLSGGQKQRVAIARALVKEPRIILADEPTGALDSNTGKQILADLKKLSEDKLVIVVSHDAEFAETYADRIIELQDGKVLSDRSRKIVQAQVRSKNLRFIGDDTAFITAGTKLNSEDLEALNEFFACSLHDIFLTNNGELVPKFKKMARVSEEGSEIFVPTPLPQQSPALLCAKDDNPNALPASSADHFSEREQSVPQKQGSLFSHGKLPSRKALRIGANSLRVKPFRLILSVLLSVVAFTMFGLFSTLMMYDERGVLEEAMQSSSESYALLEKGYYYKRITYLNGEKYSESKDTQGSALFTDDEVDQIGKRFNTDAVGVFYLSCNALADISETKRMFYDTEIGGFAWVPEGHSLRSAENILAGKYPTSENEIMISRFTFDSIAVSKYRDENGDRVKNYADIVGKTFSIGFSEPVVISGIFDSKDPDPKFYELQEAAEQDNYKYENTLLKREWKRELSSGMRRIALVSNRFYSAHMNDGESEKPETQPIDLSEYFVQSGSYFQVTANFARPQPNMPPSFSVISSDRVAVFDPGGAEKLLTVYDLSSAQNQDVRPLARALTADELAIDSIHYGYALYQYLSEQYFDDGSAIGNELYRNYDVEDADRLTLMDKIKAVSEGQFPSGGIYKPLTEEIFRTFLSDIVNFLEKYSVRIAFSAYDGNTGFDSSATIAGVYFIQPDVYGNGVYMSEDRFNAFYTERERYEWTYQTVTDYVQSEDAYIGTILIPFTHSNSFIRDFVRFSETRYPDSSFYYIANDTAQEAYSVRSAVEMFRTIFLGIGAVMAVFSCLLLFNFISLSISHKKREIGILRAVGASKYDVFRIFFAESLIIVGICFLLSVLSTVLFCGVINGIIIDQAGLSLHVLRFGIVPLLTLLAISLATCFVSTFLPVRRAAKKPPVDSIRSL